MDEEVVLRLREVAKAQKATLMEQLDLAPSPSGEMALIEARDHAGRCAMLLPSTQVPQVAASLLGMWLQCRGAGRDSALSVDIGQQREIMRALSIPVGGAEAHGAAQGFVTVSFDIGGIPLFVELPVAVAADLAKGIVSCL